MKTIYKDEYNNDGIFINLECVPYESIINKINTLDKHEKYYVYCNGGVKSLRLGTVLEQYGYNVIRVIKR